MPTTHINRITPVSLLLGASFFLIVTGNWAFFEKVTDVYPLAENNTLFIISLSVFSYCVISLLALIFSLFMPAKLVAAFFVMLTAATAYFSDQLGVVIDTEMLRNIAETNVSEASDLINTGFIIRLLLAGILPTIIIWKLPVAKYSLTKSLRYKVQAALLITGLIVLCILPLSDHYASFFREHKPIRYYSNPAYPIYSAGKYIAQEIKSSEHKQFAYLTNNVRKASGKKPRLVIFVIGETARADRFSLNGYAKNTNPELAKMDDIISYQNMSSCGTSTAISVPCMFAYAGRDEFDPDEAENTQNILDILSLAKINIIWRDNNSDSKGVATRLTYEDYKSPAINPECDIECRDTGLLHGLQKYFDKQQQDILIVLHQMGSHGPAYYKRYPKAFETFTPACQTAELAKCSLEEISNAYDNTILYTDYFLSQVIQLLKKNTEKFDTAMLYISDHGESLGKNGLYLHGLPYMFAPEEQTHVAAILWADKSSSIDMEKTRTLRGKPVSHDGIFRTLLSVFNVRTELPLNEATPLVYLKNDRSR